MGQVGGPELSDQNPAVIDRRANKFRLGSANPAGSGCLSLHSLTLAATKSELLERRSTPIFSAGLFAKHRHDQSPGMWRAAVFPEKQALPCAEQQAPIGDRHRLARARQGHLDVARHVVCALQRVLAKRGSPSGTSRLSHASRSVRAVGSAFSITTRLQLGVLAEHVRDATRHAAAGDDPRHLVGDFNVPCPRVRTVKES